MVIKQVYYSGDTIFKLQQDICCYFINYKNILPKYWYGTRIMRYKTFSDNTTIEKFKYFYDTILIKSLNHGCTPHKIRMIKDFPVMKNGGWHFTYLGGRERIKYKIQSFSHQEFNNDQYLNDKSIDFKLKNGIDFFNPNDYRFIPVKFNNRFLPMPSPDSLVQKYPDLFYLDIHLLRNIVIIFKTYVYYYLFKLPCGEVKKIVKKVLKWNMI